METSLHICMSVLAIIGTLIGVQGIGVNYGTVGNNLPPPTQAVQLIKTKGFTAVRLFEPNADILKALEGSQLKVVLGTLNQDLEKLATDPAFAATWVNDHIVPHANLVQFQYISVGNEVIPGDLSVHILPAIKNLEAALTAVNIPLPVSTSVATYVLGASFPPSQGAFTDKAAAVLAPIAAHLEAQKTPLLANIYTYFAYSGNTKNIQLDYAMLNGTKEVVRDGNLIYVNLLDAIIDAFYWALERVGAPSVDVVLTESGWPSAGGEDGVATIELAETYNNNLVRHVASGGGTPKRPGKAVETYIFALFNENQKKPGTEQNYGLFYPNLQEVYPLNLSP
ncbi:putative glucan endo-1,3-beta-glucosidase GVI [Aristolochia californica]|uniref:putative glucan endo-1,3-beta-glucosidase GVI n=1 Tax=Aristolochia californica TaxID=171875 RepID=UPI0035D670F1